MEVAHQEWRENNVPAALTLLDSTRPDLRGWEWRYVHRLCHSDLLTLKGHEGPPSFSPDGSRIVTLGRGRKMAKVWDTRTGAEVLTLKGHTDFVSTSALFSPDGSRIVTAGDHTVISPVGSFIEGVAVGDHTAKVWDAKTGAELLTLKGHTDLVISASFSPDGTRIVTASHDG